MKLVLREAKTFRHIFDSIKDNYNTYDLRFTPEGLNLQCIDPCSISIFEFFLDKEYFESYDSEYDLVISVEAESFNKCCHLIQSDDTLTLSNECNDKLSFNLESEKRKLKLKLSQLVTLNDLLDCSNKLNCSHYIKMNSKVFSQYYNDLKQFDCEEITFINKSNNKNLILKGENSITDIEIEIEKGTDHLSIFKYGDNLRERFPLKYFSMINKLSSISKNITFNIGNNKPIKVGTYLTEKSFVRLIVAPKMSDE